MIHQINTTLIKTKYVDYFPIEIGYSMEVKTMNIFNVRANPLRSGKLLIRGGLNDSSTNER